MPDYCMFWAPFYSSLFPDPLSVCFLIPFSCLCSASRHLKKSYGSMLHFFYCIINPEQEAGSRGSKEKRVAKTRLLDPEARVSLSSHKHTVFFLSLVAVCCTSISTNITSTPCLSFLLTHIHRVYVCQLGQITSTYTI